MLSQKTDSWNCRFLMCGLANVCKLNVERHGVDDELIVFKWVVWSLSVLCSGVWPTVDPDGNPLEGPRGQKSGRLCGPFFSACSNWLQTWTGYVITYIFLILIRCYGLACFAAPTEMHGLGPIYAQQLPE